MNRNKLMLLVAVVAAIAVIAGGYFLGVQPQLARADSDTSQTQSVASSNAAMQVQIAKLKAQASDMSTMQGTLASLQKSIPSTPNASALISEINAIGDGAGVKVSGITVSDATAYSPPAASTSSTSASSSTSSSSTSSSSASTSSSATPAPSATPTTPAAPTATTNSLITSTNFSLIPVTITVNGTFAQALTFVKGLQSGERLMLIDAITSASPADTTSTELPTWTFSGDVYVLTPDASSTAATTTNG